MKTITIHLDIELLNHCKKLAKQQNITLNEFIVQALTEKLKELQNDRSF